jgi:hypothetical protein
MKAPDLFLSQFDDGISEIVFGQVHMPENAFFIN